MRFLLLTTALGLLATSCVSAAEETKLPALEINAIADGVEIVVADMRIVGTQVKFDQQKQILSVEGKPAELIRQDSKGQERKKYTGRKIVVYLKDSNINVFAAPEKAK